MKLVLDRKWKKDGYSIGRLYIDGELFCNTLEDKDRGLTKDMPASRIKVLKVKDKTAIPTGTYAVTLRIQSPKFKNYKAYEFCDGYLPRLCQVPGFDGVLIHIGNTAADSSGCILVGENRKVGQVVNSTATFQKLYKRLKAADQRGENISIEIK